MIVDKLIPMIMVFIIGSLILSGAMLGIGAWVAIKKLELMKDLGGDGLDAIKKLIK